MRLEFVKVTGLKLWFLLCFEVVVSFRQMLDLHVSWLSVVGQ